MDPSTLNEIAKILAATGPWGLVAGLAWAFWRVNSRKEQEVHDLYGQLAELSKEQTEALLEVKRTIEKLHDAVIMAFLKSRNSWPPRGIVPSPPFSSTADRDAETPKSGYKIR